MWLTWWVTTFRNVDSIQFIESGENFEEIDNIIACTLNSTTGAFNQCHMALAGGRNFAINGSKIYVENIRSLSMDIDSVSVCDLDRTNALISNCQPQKVFPYEIFNLSIENNYLYIFSNILTRSFMVCPLNSNATIGTCSYSYGDLNALFPNTYYDSPVALGVKFFR